MIDIGSGHAPLIRADVLCDRFPVETVHRPLPAIYAPAGRFVVGDIECLPFTDNAFDYVYCSAVLEHLRHPEKACAEMSRIAAAGVIRTPSRLWEIMGGSGAHRWLISVANGKMIFQRKTLNDTLLNSLIPEYIRNSKKYERLFNDFYNDFYIDFHWKHSIPFEVIHEGNSDLYPVNENRSVEIPEGILFSEFFAARRPSRRLKSMLFEGLRYLLGGRKVDLREILACPQCKQGFAAWDNRQLVCVRCSVVYPIAQGVPILLKPRELHEVGI